MPILEPPAALLPLPNQPAGVPWPTTEWPEGPLPAGVDSSAIDALMARAFGPDADPRFGRTDAVLVVHGGRIVTEGYGPDIEPTTPLLSWSMAKSITHALVGLLVADGRIDPMAPAAVPEWADDERAAITLHQMLRMVDGLEFNEAYAIPENGEDAPWSHCIDMLFGAGKDNPADYTAARPARVAPDTEFNYSSGTTNLVARIVADHIGRGDAAQAWMHQHLFAPIGMHTADPTFDTAGNFIGSSYLHATARDWARFGLLYLRGGEWDGTQLIARDWVDDGRTTRAIDDDGNQYGAHWWTYPDDRGRFYAGGFGFQRVTCVPSSDLVVVRLGHTEEDDYDHPKAWFEELIALFDATKNA